MPRGHDARIMSVGVCPMMEAWVCGTASHGDGSGGDSIRRGFDTMSWIRRGSRQHQMEFRRDTQRRATVNGDLIAA
jgi:hypothetical protein